jgi:squamous cell carcinoma antigen recognized by T-cells 3
LIDGRPAFVSVNKDKSNPTATEEDAQKQFKYAVNMEKNKLFVAGLPFSTTKKDLENIFGKVYFQNFEFKMTFITI